jgi:peptidoglycan/LPS O-acetylase OafA/YrhL
MVRLGPPSWIAMGLIILIYYAALWKNGQPIAGMDWPGMSISSVFANMFYAFDSTGIKPFYSVLWTLEAELQYYVVISLIFPLIIRFSGFTIGALPILAGLLLMYPLHAYNVIFFKYIALFVMGITAFLFMTERIKPNVFLLSAAAIIAACFLQLGLPCTIAGGLTMFAIVNLKASNKFATFLGTISYSLYITHHFSGITAEFIGKSLLGGVYEPWGKILLLFIFTAISIAFAYLFFRLVEKPFMQLAARIKFKK